MHPNRILAATAATAAALALAACGTDSDAAPDAAEQSNQDLSNYPILIEHALGTTTITEKPERVATVAWGNQEVPLALGVVPVGMPEVTWGDDDGDGVLPWVEDTLSDLGAETPVLFDEADGIDFEAVADTQPDVILAGYSGLTQEEYDTLAKIAPVVAYPDVAWGTTWQEMIELDATAMGMQAEGEQLIADLDQQIADTAAGYPQLADTSVAFSWIDTTDLSTFGFYTSADPRASFPTQLGMTIPTVVTDNEDGSSFYGGISAESADQVDADVLVVYADEASLATAEADPLWSKIPAIDRGSVVLLPDNTPLAASANPSPLSIGYNLDEYVGLLAAAADKVE